MENDTLEELIEIKSNKEHGETEKQAAAAEITSKPECAQESESESAKGAAEEYVTLDEADIDKIIAFETKKAKKKGAIKGSIITAIVMLLLIVCGVIGYFAVKILTGSMPIKALGFASTGIIDNDVYNKAEGIYAVIEKEYFNEIDEEAIQNGIYKGMLEALGDPYSVYYTKEEFDEMMSASNGSFEGIGAYLQQDAQTNELSVSRPMKNSPAEAAGILSGDIIITVDGEDISKQDINLIVSKIKGPSGTEVVLGIRRGNKEFEVTVKRALVYEESIESSMIDEENKVGYIYIYSFEEDTANQFRDSLEELKSQGMERLIIDLRDNGGGYVDVCCDICDMILPDARIVSTKDKHGITMNYDSSDSEFIRMPIVILMNENSASASEIMIGALTDNDYATTVGTKSFGKGIVQEVLGLDDGSGIKVTISEYFTPSGECIHGVGFEPDEYIDLDVDKFINERIDNQLEKAKEIILKQ